MEVTTENQSARKREPNVQKGIIHHYRYYNELHNYKFDGGECEEGHLVINSWCFIAFGLQNTKMVWK